MATEMGRLSGRATPSLQDGPSRQSNENGRRSTYLLPIAVQTNRATSMLAHAFYAVARRISDLGSVKRDKVTILPIIVYPGTNQRSGVAKAQIVAMRLKTTIILTRFHREIPPTCPTPPAAQIDIGRGYTQQRSPTRSLRCGSVSSRLHVGERQGAPFLWSRCGAGRESASRMSRTRHGHGATLC